MVRRIAFAPQQRLVAEVVIEQPEARDFIRRDSLRDTTGDPWNGRTLEASTSSPPPAYNFAFTPRVRKNSSSKGRMHSS